MTDKTLTGAGAAVQGGRFLTFTLGDQECGLRIESVLEVINLLDVRSRIQALAPHGAVLATEGRSVPLVDLRERMGLADRRTDWATCIVVIDIAGFQVGAVVDAVCEVRDIATGEITGDCETGVIDFILGVSRIQDRPILLLDLDRALRLEEIGGFDPAPMAPSRN